jgi:cellulose synthase/poly-beta-1,6-N-acetylglucosamine synthase-like glycosyltransferase
MTEGLRPFVSIVIPCYNSKRTVGDCLSSLAGQTYPRDRYEVILVDNGSTDGTCEQVRVLYPWVKLIHSLQKGSAFARNAGIREASGELILSTDSDCVADKAWIAQLVSALETAGRDVAAVGGTILPYSTKTAVERYQPAWAAQPDITRMTSGVLYTAAGNAAFRTSILRLVGGFDGACGHDDTDLGIRILKAGYRVDYTDKALVQHRNPITLSELYKHRVKYGSCNYALSKKHPLILGDPTVPGTVRKLFWATLRRVVGDLVVKLPIALVTESKGRPRVWPVIDAAMALGNFNGFSRAARTAFGSKLSVS